MIEGSGSIPLTHGSESGSRRPKNMWIRIRNTAYRYGALESNRKHTYRQRCGTVIIFYGSGSDLRKVMVPVPVPVPTYEKLWFRFRFQLIFLKSYGSGSSSISRP
jgi:hypothetical protein